MRWCRALTERTGWIVAGIYEDDGLTQAHTRGDYRLTPLHWHPNAGGYVLELGPSSGTYHDARTRWNLVFHDLPAAEARLDGQPVRSRRTQDGVSLQIPDDGQRHIVTLTKA